MKNLMSFEQYIKEGVDRVRDLSELRAIEKWIESFWSRVEGLSEENLNMIFQYVEKKYGQEISGFIDKRYSADKLHYYQTGSTVSTGGVDTGDFIENFSEISLDLDNIINNYLG